MHIGKGAQWVIRAHPVVVLILVFPWFPGAARNTLMWLLVLQKKSTLHYVWQSAKQCGFASSLQNYLDMRWISLLSIAITRAM
jgi:hypothetical protein